MVNKKYPAVHSVMNKIIGVILFLLPLTFARIDLRYSGAFACVVAPLLRYRRDIGSGPERLMLMIKCEMVEFYATKFNQSTHKM